MIRAFLAIELPDAWRPGLAQEVVVVEELEVHLRGALGGGVLVAEVIPDGEGRPAMPFQVMRCMFGIQASS